MEVRSRQKAGVTILEPEGKITIGEGDVALRDAIHEALEAGASKLLINMERATYVDSSGIAELVAAHREVESRGQDLKLAGLRPRVKDLLGVTQLVGIFEIFDNVDGAIESFDENAEAAEDMGGGGGEDWP